MSYSDTTNIIVDSAFTVERIGQTPISGLLVMILSELVAELVLKVGVGLYETTLVQNRSTLNRGYEDKGLAAREKNRMFYNSIIMK